MKVILTKDVAEARQERRDEGRWPTATPRTSSSRRSSRSPASGGAYRAYQHDIASREEKRKREREEAEIAATRIGSTTLTMGVKVGEGGKLYGSINNQDIAEALGRRGIVVDSTRSTSSSRSSRSAPTRSRSGSYAGMTPEVTIVVEPKG